MKNKHISSLSRTRDRRALEKRRIKAITLHQKGQSQYQIAKKLKVSFEAVSNWVELYKKRGIAGLKSKGKPGAKPNLTDEDRKKLKQAILQGPQAFGYETDLWTLERMAALIKKLTAVRFKTTHTWRTVVSLGFSCQKPETRAKERNEKAIRTWMVKTFPRLKKMG